MAHGAGRFADLVNRDLRRGIDFFSWWLWGISVWEASVASVQSTSIPVSISSFSCTIPVY